MSEGCVVSSSTACIPRKTSNDAVTLSPTAKTFGSEDLRKQNYYIRIQGTDTYLVSSLCMVMAQA